MNQILCSTGALIGRPNGRNHRLLAEYAGGLHCDGFEFMMYDSWYDTIDQVAADVRAMELNIPVMHCEKRIGQNISRGGQEDWREALRRFEINCEMANEIGAKTMVLHLWDGMISDGNFSNNMRAYPYLEQIASERNILLTVENVVCNQRDPMSHGRNCGRNIRQSVLPLIRRWRHFIIRWICCMRMSGSGFGGKVMSGTCISMTIKAAIWIGKT